MFGSYSNDVRVTRSTFSDIGFIGVQFHDKDTKDDGQKNILVDNNSFNGCGNTDLWQPNCVKGPSKYNVC